MYIIRVGVVKNGNVFFEYRFNVFNGMVGSNINIRGEKLYYIDICFCCF